VSNDQIALSNNSNVYILGAGFSAARGIPLVSNFMRVMRDAYEWCRANSRLNDAAAIEAVLNFRLESAAAAYRVQLDLENVEELFSLASVIGDQLAISIRKAIAATIAYSEAARAEPEVTLSLTQPTTNIDYLKRRAGAAVGGATQYRVPAYAALVEGLIGRLHESPSAGPSTFITFNYDLVLERALTTLSRPYGLGFGHAIVAKSNDAVASHYVSAAPVQILKMHGSVNWLLKADESIEMYNSYEDLRQLGQAPYLIPPTWRKSFSSTTQAVWAAALQAIENATRLVVIGFSMPATDAYFKYLLAAGLRRNVSLREIVFLDPNKDAIESRAKQLFAQLDRQPAVSVIDRTVEQLLTSGTGTGRGTFHDIGRPISPQIQTIYSSI
jgi:hypothetical protein